MERLAYALFIVGLLFIGSAIAMSGLGNATFAGFDEISGTGIYVRQGHVDNMTVIEFVWDGTAMNMSKVRPIINSYIEMHNYKVKAFMYIDTGYAIAYVEVRQ